VYKNHVPGHTWVPKLDNRDTLKTQTAAYNIPKRALRLLATHDFFFLLCSSLSTRIILQPEVKDEIFFGKTDRKVGTGAKVKAAKFVSLPHPGLPEGR
jgi:hypothetical protein